MNNLGNAENLRLLNREGSVLGRKEILLVTSFGIVFTTIFAMAVGKDLGWDQENYHYYAVYAWLHGRVNYHIAPAGIQSWYNPLIYVPHYWLINHVRPVVAGGIFGASVGLNFVLIYILTRLVLPMGGSWWGRSVAFLCGAVGFSDPFFLEFIGSTDIDNLVSLPVLVSLCILCWTCLPGVATQTQNRAYAWAGFLLGAASGLKWTCFVFAAGMGLALLTLWPVLRLNLRRYLWFSGGGLLGFLITGGYWSWFLWTHYRNPFFPHWNRTFRSPWALTSNFRDMRFPPRSVEAALMYPFQWLVGVHSSSEDQFRDARYALLCVFIFVIGAALLGQWIARRWGRGGDTAETHMLVAGQHWWLLLTFSVFSYLLWIKTFAIQRYLIPLGLITGLLLWLALDWLLPARSAKLAAFFFLAIFSVLWTRIDVTGWRLPYGSDWYGLKLAPEVEAPGNLFIMVGGGAMGYIVPFLPDSTRTVRLLAVTMPESETELVRQAREIISQHAGPIRSLAISPLEKSDYSQLSRFGLALDAGACVQFRSFTDQFTSCRVVRQPLSASQGKPAEPPGTDGTDHLTFAP
jgi:hypothetical protein